MKRVFSVVLAIACLLTVMPFAEVSAGLTSEGLRYTISDGRVTITELTDRPDSPREIVIPSEIEGCPVTAIRSSAFRYRALITSVVIPDTVITIGDYAFYGTGITSLTLPDSLTTIGSYAFSDCDKFTSVAFSDSLTTIGSYAFSGCGSLESLTIPATVTSVGYRAFEFCKSLKIVTIGSALTSFDAGAFYDCTSLEEVIFPDGLTKTGEFQFANTGLKHITIPDGVTDISRGTFAYCKLLESVTIPGSVSRIEEAAFEDCSKLTTVTIGKGVTFIGESAFGECTALEKLNITDVASWCRITFVTGYLGVLESNPLYYGADLYLNGELVTELIIPDGVTAINNHVFKGCESITSVVLPKSITSIESSAFYNCANLTDVYYAGSKEEWSLIRRKYFPSTVTIHYNWAELSQGDLTGDGIVDMFDAMALYTGVSGNGTLTEAQELAADINADGTIDMFDALALYIQVSGQ